MELFSAGRTVRSQVKAMNTSWGLPQCCLCLQQIDFASRRHKLALSESSSSIVVKGCVCLLSVYFFHPLRGKNVFYMGINDFLNIHIHSTSMRKRSAWPDVCSTVSTCRFHPSKNRLCLGNLPQDGPTQANLHCFSPYTLRHTHTHPNTHTHTCKIQRKNRPPG